MAIAAALQFWKDFDIHSFQRFLDTQATDIAERQDESNQSRKKLIELSRDFKKNASEEERQHVAPLLKTFQVEIDSLSRRSQSAESTYLQVYRKLIEVPDPVPPLEQGVQCQQKLINAQDLEIENKQLRDTLKEYNTEFAQVKNQEVTILRLREQVRELEEKMQQTVSAALFEKEAELLQAFHEKERKFEQNTVEVMKKLSQADAKIASLEAALQLTQSELFELKNKFDEEAAAKAAEVDILMTDLERANQRADFAERELEHTRMGQQNQLEANTLKSMDKLELELELQTKEKEILHHLNDIQQLQAKLVSVRDASSRQISALEEMCTQKAQALRELEAQLATQSDYEEVKRELNIMKMVEFSSSTHEELPVEAVLSKPLEVMLLGKNRELQNDNTSLKLELSKLQDHLNVIQLQYDDSLKTIQEQKGLIAQLEGDLLHVHPYLALQAEMEEVTTSSAGIMLEAVRDIHPEQKGFNVPPLLPIVANQRERLKQRNMELERESAQQKQTISILEHTVESMRTDNVKLYEKIKFLQSYPTTRGVSSSEEVDTVNRYSAHYEAQLDPFSAFNTKERQRKYMQLSGPDKATLAMGRFILSSKLARMFTFFYAVFLHLLVMLVLFRLVNSAACEWDKSTDCSEKFSEHMQLFHLHDPAGLSNNNYTIS